MEHRKKGRKLSRTASHRKALLSNLSIALILHKRIETTVAKAKELRMYIEPLVTKAKTAYTMRDSEPAKNVHLRRIAKKKLKSDQAVSILFDDIGPKVVDRNGGYTRILKTGFRKGDGGDTAIIEFVDYSYLDTKETPKDTKKEGKPGAKKTKSEVDETEATIEKKPKKKAEKKETTDTDKTAKPKRKTAPRKKKEETEA